MFFILLLNYSFTPGLA